ncbi:MAG: enoyl-CoA hydratase-related protein, partial [Lautropia sp.]
MTIRIERDGAVTALVFARAERKNAITAAMYAALADGLAAAATAPDVKVALIHGDGGVFTAGNDLADFLHDPPRDDQAPVMRFLRALEAFPKPLVAAVQGAAIGVGTTLLLHCDAVYAAEDASFALPFVNLGICPEAGSTFLLPALAGYARAAEKLLFGEPFGAAEAREIGLVNRLLPAAEVVGFARERARALATRPLASLIE